MTEDEKVSALAGVFVATMVWLIILVGCLSYVDHEWELDAIKHNAASYNPTTGAFEWIEKD